MTRSLLLNSIRFYRHYFCCDSIFNPKHCVQIPQKKSVFIIKQLVMASLLCLSIGSHAQESNSNLQSNPENAALENDSYAAKAERTLRPFHAKYVAYRSNKEVGDIELKLTKTQAENYELFYRSDISRFFLTDKRSETTIFVNQDSFLKPREYKYRRTGTGPNKDLTLTFNDSNKTINVNNEKEIPWDGEFENQLFRIDVPHRLSLGETEFVYDFVNYRGQKRQYKLTLVEIESLNLPYGQLNAAKVKIERKSNTRVTYAWFAPSLNHNLVRLKQYKDGKEQGDMKLNDFSYQ